MSDELTEAQEKIKAFNDKKEQDKAVRRESYVSKYEWKRYFSKKAFINMCKPISALGDGISGMVFMIEPFAMGNKPLLCIIRYDDYYIIGQCASSTAACKSIQQMSTWTNPYNILTEMSKARKVYVGSSRSRNGFVSGGPTTIVENREKYSYISGFKNVLRVTEDANTEIITNIIYDIVSKAESSARSIVFSTNPISTETLLKMANLNQSDYFKASIAFRILGLLFMLDWEGDINEKFIMNLNIAKELTDFDPSTALNKFNTFIQNSMYITPGCNLDLLQTFGCTSCMPSDKGWGFLTPISSSEQISMKGINSYSLGKYLFDNLYSSTSVYDNQQLSQIYAHNVIELMRWVNDNSYDMQINKDVFKHYISIIQSTGIFYHNMHTAMSDEEKLIYEQNYKELNDNFNKEFQPMIMKSMERKKNRLENAMKRVVATDKNTSIRKKLENISMRIDNDHE